MNGTLRTLEQDSELADAAEHLRLRREQYEHGRIKAVTGYANTVGSDVTAALAPDEAIWSACELEWGKGPGFKDRVIQRLVKWSRSQNDLHAHEQTELAGLLPIDVEELALEA